MPKRSYAAQKEHVYQKERAYQRESNELEFTKAFYATIIGAITFIAGLAWRDAINAVLELFPQIPGVWGLFFYATVLTVVFAIIGIKLDRRQKRMQEELEDLKEELEEARKALKKTRKKA